MKPVFVTNILVVAVACSTARPDFGEPQSEDQSTAKQDAGNATESTSDTAGSPMASGSNNASSSSSTTISVEPNASDDTTNSPGTAHCPNAPGGECECE